MFDSLIQEAKKRSKQLDDQICDLNEKRKKLEERLSQYKDYWRKVESDVERALQKGQWISLQPFLRSGSIIKKGDENYWRLTTFWEAVMRRLNNLIDRVQHKIDKLKVTKDEVDFWILEKEEAWGQLEPERVQKQLQAILQAGEDLSQLILGHKVEVFFEYQENGPLAYIPTSFKKRSKIYLSAEPLGENPPHILDIYKALIIHEIGHLLLHLKDDYKEYCKVRRILTKKINVDPLFFKIFNILLDEQLERRLRDRKKEWRVWFNRLDFYAQKYELWELRKQLCQSTCRGTTFDKLDLQPFAEKGLIKLYDDPKQPFAIIQSGEFLTSNYGCSRLFAFFYMFRYNLPRNTVSEDWLKDCLNYIPRKFTDHDLFEIFHLAFKIYQRMIGDLNTIPICILSVIDKTGSTFKLPIPGHWITKEDEVKNLIDLRNKIKGKGGVSIELDIKKRSSSFIPPFNPEGEPQPPQAKNELDIRLRKQPKKPIIEKGTHPFGRLGGGGGFGSPYNKSPAWDDIFSIEDSSQGKGKGKGKIKKVKTPLSAKEKLSQKLHSGHISAKEKSRLRKEINKQEKNSKQDKLKDTFSQPSHIPEKSLELPQSPATSGLDSIEKQISKPSSDPLPNIKKNFTKEVDKMLEQIKQEMATKKSLPVQIKWMIPEDNSTSDYKNTQPDRRFPECEKIMGLMPNSLKRKKAILKIKKYNELLRPYFMKYDHVKQIQEQQYSGQRVMNSGIKKYVLYNEQRIFQGLRMDDLEDYSNVHISVLIDTSASMKTNGRLDRTRLIATLLAECFRECISLDSAFFGYNQNLYLCGSHEDYAVNSLEPSGKTNEAAALDYIRRQFASIPHHLKLVIILTDGLPTSCSVEAVRWVVNDMEQKYGFRFLYGALSNEQHPAYLRRVNLTGTLNRQTVMTLGRSVLEMFV